MVTHHCPVLVHPAACLVIPPGSGKSYQAAKLISAQSGKLQPQGSRTLLHCQQDPQQEQQQQYLLLSPDVIVKQMKVGCAPTYSQNRGSAARCCALDSAQAG